MIIILLKFYIVHPWIWNTVWFWPQCMRWIKVRKNMVKSLLGFSMDKVSIKVLTKRGCKIHYKIRRILCLDMGIGAYCRFTFLNEVTYFYANIIIQKSNVYLYRLTIRILFSYIHSILLIILNYITEYCPNSLTHYFHTQYKRLLDYWCTFKAWKLSNKYFKNFGTSFVLHDLFSFEFHQTLQGTGYRIIWSKLVRFY